MGITPQSDQDLNQQLINLQGNTPSMLTPVNQGNNINTVDTINQIEEDDHKDINLVSKIPFSNENELGNELFPNLVECSICEISFCGTNATLEKHMFDAHKR